MTFRYSPVQRWAISVYRKCHPVPGSPWTKGDVEDICNIHLVPPEKLKLFFADCIHRLREARGGDVGNYLEFGVFNGSSLGSAYLTAKELGVDSMKFFGFDSFEGLPEGTEDEHDILEKDFYCCPFEKTKECLQRRGVAPADVVWVKGVYDVTLTDETIQRYTIDNVGIVFVDCDTYSSSKAVLTFLTPLITKPTIVCFDDWKLYDMDLKGTGEYRSFNEFLENNRQFSATEIPSYNRKSKTFLVAPNIASKQK